MLNDFTSNCIYKEWTEIVIEAAKFYQYRFFRFSGSFTLEAFALCFHTR